jgi:hypothetical protein
MNVNLPPRLVHPKPRREGRLRCPAHLKFVRSFACTVYDCMERPTEAAHIRIGTDGGTSLKPSDCWVISLCATHHAEQHRGEASFAEKYRLDTKAIARGFWEAFRQSNPQAVRRAEEKLRR